MDIPVEDHHALESSLAEGKPGGHGHVVEQAEAHRPGRQRVMTRRAVRAEGGTRLAVEQKLDHPHGPARGMQRRVEGPSTDGGVGVEGAPAASAESLDRIDVGGRVDGLERRPVHRG